MSSPPLFQAVPSVHARRVSPRGLVAMTGCFRFRVEPGGITIADRAPERESIRSHCTWPSVSHAASTSRDDSPNENVLIGQAPMFQSCSLVLEKVLTASRDVSKYVSRWTVSVADR